MQGPELWKAVLAQLNINNGVSELSQSEWRALVSRKLVPEVKQEIVRFYGNTNDEDEIQHPGLDYANANHRLRLSHFPYHKALFKAFDALKMTDYEIYTLCKWHGTKKAKDDHERKTGCIIEDTTWDGIAPYERASPTVTFYAGGWMTVSEPYGATEATESGEDVQMEYPTDESGEDIDQEGSAISEEESEDEIEQSVGVDLNQRLRASAETNAQARARGEPVSVMDDAWEQWLKEAAERAASPRARRPDTTGSISQLRGQDLAFVTQHLRDTYLPVPSHLANSLTGGTGSLGGNPPMATSLSNHDNRDSTRLSGGDEQ